MGKSGKSSMLLGKAGCGSPGAQELWLGPDSSSVPVGVWLRGQGLELPASHEQSARSRTGGRVGTRVAELAAAVCVLIVAAPLMAVIALLLLLQREGPALYRQTRVGCGGRHFQMLKFRTLPPVAESQDECLIAAVSHGDLPISDAVAALKHNVEAAGTGFGRCLRRMSLDELPQLWHVVTGDMALVGPRPLRPFEVEALETWQLARHDMRPGITGLWQIMGRSEIPWDVRIQLDCLYVRRRSLGLDVWIVVRTPLAVLRRKGAL